MAGASAGMEGLLEPLAGVRFRSPWGLMMSKWREAAAFDFALARYVFYGLCVFFTWGRDNTSP